MVVPNFPDCNEGFSGWQIAKYLYSSIKDDIDVSRELGEIIKSTNLIVEGIYRINLPLKRKCYHGHNQNMG